MTATAERTKKATVYRMVKDKHVCPYGIKVVHLLEAAGFEVQDRHLTTPEETDAFKSEHDVKTTPQVWIGDDRVGGYEATKERLGHRVRGKGETTYRPVVALFAVALAMVVALRWGLTGALGWEVLPNFVAAAMTLLALQKLKDVESFSTMFVGYDLLAQRWVPYAYVYPYAEAAAGVLMLAGALPFLSGPLALAIGGVGAVSVFKAVYLDKRELKCACVGGDSNVPLGFVSLSENVFMLGMGSWTLWSWLAA